METVKEKENNDVIIFNFKITKRQFRMIVILLTICAIAGVTLFFMKHS
jgi:hypothetical protein